MTIRKRGNMFIVTDSSGKKILGRHRTRKAALAQQGAIKASEARRRKR